MLPERELQRLTPESGVCLEGSEVEAVCGTTISASASAVTLVASNLYFTVIAPLPTIRCDCALRSFEIAELFLLVGAENCVNCGLHAGVRDDQPCQQTCFSIGESFDLLLIYVFTADCKQLLSCSSKRRHQRLETTLFPHHYLLDSFNLGGRQTEICSQRGVS
jgi:hypothetical protein